MLKRFIKTVRGLDLNTPAARDAVLSVRLSKREFTQCGGIASPDASHDSTYSFGRQIVGASRDIRRIITTGKCSFSEHPQKAKDHESSRY